MAFDESQKKGIIVIFLLILLSLVAYMLSSYIGAIVVGGLIAYFLHPVQKWLRVKLKSQKRAQIVLVISSTVVILLFMMLFVVPLVNQTQILYHQSGPLVDQLLETIKMCPTDGSSAVCEVVSYSEDLLGKNYFTDKGQEILEKISLFVFEGLQGIISRAVSVIVFIFIMGFSIFYFLENGENIVNQAVDIIPLQARYKTKILYRLKDTIDAVVGGNFVTSLLQGLFGGVIFFLLGIPSALFWGLLMAILAFIPIVGPTFIWAPTVLVLFIEGATTKALILLVYSVLILGTIEHFVKPKLIGKKIQLSTFAIFLGVIGGLSLFGILGLFFGPIIVALLVTSIEIYREMM